MNKIYDHVHQLPRPSVTSVTLLGNNFDDATVEMLLKLKEEKPSLITLCGLALDQTEANFKGMNLRPADARLLAPEIIVRASLTSLNLSDNNLAGETGYVKATAVQGPSFNVGDRVIYQGCEMIVSKGIDSDGEIKMVNLSGVKALAHALRVNPSLTSVNLLKNRLETEAASVLLKVKEEKPMLRTLCGLTHAETKLDYRNQGLGQADAMLLAPEISVMTSLTSVNLLGNHFDTKDASMLLKVKEEKPMLRTLCGLTHAETELSYFNQRLGPADAMLLAPEISVMASVTSVRAFRNS